MGASKKRIEPGIWRTASGSYQIHYRDALGRQRSRTFDRLIDARSFKAEMRVRKRRGDLQEPRGRKTKFSEWAQAYLDQKVALRERTLDKYESALRVHLLPEFGDASLTAIARSDVQAWVVSLKRRGYAPETIRGFYDLLAAMMKLAEEEGLVARTPCRRINLPAVIKHEQHCLTPEEVERLAAAVDPRYRALVYVAAYLGLRWQELAGLRRRYLDLSARPATLRVVSTIERAHGRYRVVDLGKTKAARRTLKMPDFLADMLTWHVDAFPNNEWVFPAPEGGFLTYVNFRRRVWEPAVREAGLVPLTIHQLRHTAAALMVDEGADPLQIKRRMGHEDIRTTFNTYGHLVPDREEHLVSALDRRQKRAAAQEHADFLLTSRSDTVVDLDEKRRSEQEKELVDQRGVEPLTSPVRAVRKTFTAVYEDSRIRPSMQDMRLFQFTPTHIVDQSVTGVMLGVC